MPADEFEVKAGEERAVRIDLASKNGGINKTLIFSYILYIPIAGLNLISCGQLDSTGISAVNNNSLCKVLDWENGTGLN